MNELELFRRGKRISNPIVKYVGRGDDSYPICKYPSCILNSIAKKEGKTHIWDFDTEESYLK